MEKQKELDVNIDFDEASKCWRENKKVGINGMFSYICKYKLPNGKKCYKPYYSKSINYLKYINSSESDMDKNDKHDKNDMPMDKHDMPMYCHKHFLIFLNPELKIEKETEKNIIQTRSKRKTLA